MIALLALSHIASAVWAPSRLSPKVSDSLMTVRVVATSDRLAARARIFFVGPNGTGYAVDDSENVVVALARDGNISRLDLGHSGVKSAQHIYSSAGLLGDTIWVWDRWNGELITLRIDGTALARQRLSLPSSRFEGAFFLPRHFLSDGSYVAEEIATSSSVGDFAAVGRLVLHVTRTGAVIDTIGHLRDPKGVLALQKGDGRMIVTKQPWAAHDMLGVPTAVNTIAIVAQQNSSSLSDTSFVLRLVEPLSPDSTRSFAYPYHRIALVDSTINNFIDGVANTSFGRSFATRDAALRAIGEEVYRPRWLPPVYGLVMTAAQSVWVIKTDEIGRVVWMLVDGNGHVVSVVRPPRDAELVGASKEFVWVRRHAGNNDQVFVLCRIARESSGGEEHTNR